MAELGLINVSVDIICFQYAQVSSECSMTPLCNYNACDKIIPIRGVELGVESKCMRKQGRRSGQERFVTQLCPAGGVRGAVNPQRGPGRSPGSKSIFGNGY